MDNVRPRCGTTAAIVRCTRALDHRAIRAVIRNHEDIIYKRFGDAIAQNCSRYFWREVKHIRKNNAGCSNRTEDFDSPEEIASLFMSKYKDLYVSVAYDQK